MSTEIRNWDLVAKAMKTAGSTSSQMYIRAKALAEGKPDSMPKAFHEHLAASPPLLDDQKPLDTVQQIFIFIEP